MDLNFSKEDEAFRKEVRDFIAEAYTPAMRAKHARSKHGYIDKESHIQWQKSLAKKGWLAPNWPTEYGGPGFTASQKYIFDVEMGRAGVPHTVPFGPTMVAPVIMKFGTPEQKKRFLPDILATNVLWCQGYSEPGSGSDLASLQTKAENKGDHYLVNGSKIWTSVAQWADWIFCLVRTSKEGKPQEGISFLLIDMKTPGVKVEPLVLLDGTPAPHQEVNQVFFTDVKVPIENRIGEENKGWTYAKYLLEFERGNPYSAGLYRALNKVRKIAADTKVGDHTLADEPEFQAAAADLNAQIVAMEFTELRIFSALSTGGNVGPESSLLKCRGTEIQQAISQLAVEAVGHYTIPFVEDGMVDTNEPPVGPAYAFTTAPYYFSLRKASIYAGSNEVQRNIMAKAVLGLLSDMAANITTRQASAGDIQALARVWHDGWHESHAALDPDVAARRPIRFFDERIATAVPDSVVACVDGEVVGFAHWEDDGIGQVFVLPAWHGKGIAPLVLSAAEAALRAKGHRRIWLQCRKGNNRARAFYEKHGWAVVREVDHSLGHMEGRKPVIVWRLEKSLG